MLAGGGITISSVVVQPPVVTEQNLSEWVKPGWNLNTPGPASGPDNSLATDAYLDGLFTTKG
jgi:hypothetical protein